MAAPPVRIGPYELVSRLGVGGMAETYLAVRRGPGGFEQRVCLKRVRHDLERDPEFVRQFMAEAAIAAKLRHATIAQVLDFGCDQDDYYLALELVDGLDLRALLEKVGGGLPADITLYIAVELATALDFAHRAGGVVAGAPVVHRDVSTSNALISLEGEVKLADFGIARSLSAPQHTQTGVVKGKVPYLAPEYARSGRFDQRCDLFSLGVLLYETACGARPHDGATDLETLERASSGKRQRLTERAPELPSALAEIIEQLLEHDPELRFQSAGILLEALLGLPAPNRARRELGTLVAGLRGDQHAADDAARKAELASSRTSPLGPADASAPTRTAPAGVDRATARTRTRVIEPAESTAVRSGSARWRGSAIALAAAISFACAVLGAFLVRGRSADAVESRARGAMPASAAGAHAPTDPHATSPTQDSARAAAVSEIVARPSASPAPAQETAAPLDANAAPAQLEVVVLPYGDVFVDGKPVGKAPATLSLTPGQHSIAGKHRDGVFRRQVTLAPGEHRHIVLR